MPIRLDEPVVVQPGPNSKLPRWLGEIDDPDQYDIRGVRNSLEALHLLALKPNLVPMAHQSDVKPDMFGAGTHINFYEPIRVVAHGLFRLGLSPELRPTLAVFTQVMDDLRIKLHYYPLDEMLGVILYHMEASEQDYDTLMLKVRQHYWKVIDSGHSYTPKPTFGVRPDGSWGYICTFARCTKFAVGFDRHGLYRYCRWHMPRF